MSKKDPNVEYNKSYENIHKTTQSGKLLPEHPNYGKPGYDEYGNPTGASSNGCFPPGTAVWTPGGERRIEDIGCGALVWSRSPNGELEAKQVLRRTSHRANYLWTLRLEGRGPIRTTAVHRFHVDGKWVQARRLKAGDRISGVDRAGSDVRYRVAESTASSSVSDVYNLVVDNNFTFFADGSLVHSFGHLPVLRALVL